jgi:hypothetical protein
VIALGFGLFGLGAPRRRLRLGYALTLLLVACVLWQAGCAAGVSSTLSSKISGTPAGTYPLTVTATAGTAQQSASLTLVVQ